MGRIGENSKPAWLEGLMGETFFAGCGVHQTRRKNEKNIFCLACCVSFCPHCLPSHRSHPLLQVRRYVYHDVVRLVDLQKLIDSSFIQPYTINGAKVIFVKQRTQSSRAQSGGSSSSSGNSSRAWRAGGSTTPNMCFTCDRILQPPFHFCSLSCKVEHMVCQGGEGIWMSSSSSQLDGLRLNSALLDDHDHDQDDDDDSNDNQEESSSAGEAVKRKKKAPSTTTDGGSGGGGATGSTPTRTSRFLSVFSLNSRRKQGAPHRAPLS